jgi:hypothetical protein
MPAYTAEQLAAVRRAIAQGEMRVKYPDGSEITFRSADELLKIEARMAADLEPLSNNNGTSFNRRISVACF